MSSLFRDGDWVKSTNPRYWNMSEWIGARVYKQQEAGNKTEWTVLVRILVNSNDRLHFTKPRCFRVDSLVKMSDDEVALITIALLEHEDG